MAQTNVTSNQKQKHELCPSCGSGEAKFLFRLATDQVVRCEACDLTFAISAPVEKTALYNDGYFSGQASQGGYQDYQAEYVSHRETFRRRLLNAEKKLGKAGVLLDYGCAYGHLGHVAAQEGWQVVATDIAFEAVHRAVHEYGLAGFVSDLSQPPLKKGVFDLVTLYDVIEHVRDPKDIVNALTSLLGASGVLHLTTPDVGSPSAHLLRTRWYHYKPQEHLIYFSRKTLRALLESCGLEVFETRSAPSHMTAHDILVRLRRYSKFIAEGLLALAKAFRLDKRVVKIHIGEMQAWARPKGARDWQKLNPGASGDASVNTPAPRTVTGKTNVQRLLPFLSCPTCASDLKANADESEIHCLGCSETYQVKNQIPVMLPNKARTRQAA